MTLKLRIISGFQFPDVESNDADCYVKIQILGIPEDEQKQKTKVVEDNGMTMRGVIYKPLIDFIPICLSIVLNLYIYQTITDLPSYSNYPSSLPLKVLIQSGMKSLSSKYSCQMLRVSTLR